MKGLLLFLALVAGSIAGAQDSWNTSLLHNWQEDSIPGTTAYDNAYNEIWGMVINDREIAVIGSTYGTHMFDVTDPSNVTDVGYVEGAVTGPIMIHRDFHDFGGYLYTVADEGFSSLQIIDVSNLPDSYEVVYDSSTLFQRSHNIFIDEANAVMYVCGGNSQLDLYSLEDPTNPTLIIDCDASVSGWNAIGYCHDVYVKDGIAYCNAADALYIVDFTTPDSPVILGNISDYPESGYNHSGWLHGDGDMYALADETHGARIKICDVSDPTDINVISLIASEVDDLSIVHNLIFHEDILHVSHYYDGYYAFDCSDPENPFVAAYYDTSEIPHQPSYEGAWGVYPFLPSGNILVSDMQEGLFVIEVTPATSIEEVAAAGPQVFPNPASPGGKLHLQGVEIDAGTKVYLTSLDGKQTVLDQWSAFANVLRTELPESLPAGAYVLSVVKGDAIQNMRLICR